MIKVENTLKELLLGIAVFGILCELVGVWFVEDAVKYSIGLAIGVVLAALCAVHMWWTLNRNFEKNGSNEGAVTSYAIRSNVIRYAVILIVFLVICLTDFAYPLAAFLGIMSLKAGAYMQPVLHRILNRK